MKLTSCCNLSCAKASQIWSNEVQPISTGFNGGPAACSFRSAARPSQNWTKLSAALYTVGALTPPNCPLIPSEYCLRSTPPVFNPWQVAQEIVLSADKRVSWYRAKPNSTFAGSVGKLFIRGWRGSFLNSSATVSVVKRSLRTFFAHEMITAFSLSSRLVPQCIGIWEYLAGGIEPLRAVFSTFAKSTSETGCPFSKASTIAVKST